MTQLCAITGCRIRDRHLAGCDDDDCRGCLPRVAEEGYACQSCMDRADRQLATIIELTPDARGVAYGQARRGESNGGSANKPGSRPPGDTGAAERLAAVQNAITTLLRDIEETRGFQSASAATNGRLHPDPLVRACRALRRHLGWLRHALDDHEPRVIIAFAEIDDCTRRITGIINGPQPGRYAGPCSQVDADGNVCREDVTARPGSTTGRCRTCGAEYDVDEQQAWMRSEIEDYLARPVEIAGVLLRLGFPIGYSTIAAYAAKGQLIAHGHDEHNRPLYRIGDVITLRIGAKKR